MSTLSLEPLLHQNSREIRRLRFDSSALKLSSSFHCLPPRYGRTRLCRFIKPTRALSVVTARASDAAAAATVETTTVQESTTADFIFPLKRTDRVEGKILVRLDKGTTEKTWRLTVGCTLTGKWILHWGVSYIGDVGREWDQPPAKMMPPGSVPIKDYAIETPLEKASSSGEGNHLYEVNIDIDPDSEVAAVNFVLKDEESGMWYQHRGTDFKVPLDEADANVVGAKRGFGLLPEDVGQIPSIVVKTEVSSSDGEDISSGYSKQEDRGPYRFYEEVPFVKQIHMDNSVSVSVRKCPDTARNIVHLDTDLPGDVIVHWGVCTSSSKVWEIPTAHHPPQTSLFKNKALRTLLEHKDQGNGSWGIFTLDEELSGFLFVLKLEENIWLKHSGNDFYIPLTSNGSSPVSKKPKVEDIEASVENEQVTTTAYSKGIVTEIRNLIGDISSEKVRRTQSKEVQETILQEIERLAAEAYGIFRRSQPTFLEEEAVSESEELEPPLKICSGTGTGYEIVCQGFNWESHKSASWYKEIMGKASELGSLGFSVIWLPPPTDSVSPEGYMPRDLYNLNSRYGTFEELKDVVKTFHDLNIKVLGDVVLNHRCAQYKNQNGVWNIFGGRLNWDDRAVVADDPHFQGRGNKSSGDNFHAAPNIDHSQDFVRNDLKEWLLWLRKEIGYDGWRLDFARGFWGGYVKDYMEATEPYFAVGEFWDSLSYTYGEMDHNQDAHRQRIVDWINATNGTASAFDVTTKGILHAALERCEYWRLSDQNGKPPGVIGWWPSRAVTFVENHDTGSTQGHWRFPGGKEMQGYAYILTHPGTPAVFYDHIFSHHQHEIASLISLRNRNKINCRSSMKITKADRDVYAAIIDEKVAVKIGPGSYEPPSGGKQKWSKAVQGRDYIAWEDTSS